MEKIKKNLIIVSLIAAVFLFSGCGRDSNPTYSINLEVWGLFDNNNDFLEIVKAYKEVNPFIEEIKYRKFTPDTYRSEVIEAIAAGNGPDIFLINNAWMPSIKDITTPAPRQLVNQNTLKNNFVDVVEQDFLIDGEVYGMPLSVDSLALYYNKQALSAAGIAVPPKNWSEFSDAVKKLTNYDENGNITNYGAAIGTSENVNRSSDLVSLLFLQNGLSIVDPNTGMVRLDASVSTQSGDFLNAGENALNFYTQFANGNSPVYTWDKDAHFSIDAFAQGDVAMMINYSWHIDTIRSKNPKLDFEVSRVPQLDESDPVNVGNYWSFVVAKNKSSIDPETGQSYGDPVAFNNARIHESWQFLKYLTTKNNGSITLTNAISGNQADFDLNIDPAKSYIEKKNVPAARLDLLQEQGNDAFLEPFVFGNINAKSWKRVDSFVYEQVLNDMIKSVNQGDNSVGRALDIAESRLNEIRRN